MSATELFDEVRQFLKECGCVDCDGRGVSAHRSYDLNCIDVRFRLADSHLEQFATNLRRARAALKPAAQPIETMDHGFSPDEPAPVSNEQTSTDTPPTAGDSTQDEPAATSLDTLPKQQSGGNPAPHFFRQGGPMLPSEREPWYGKFKPDQIYKVLWHWVFVEGNALCCAETTGMSVEECFDIASIYMRELEWSLYARREDAAAYLNNLHWINQTRYELTIWPRQRRAKKEQSK